jgi:hypothetical protein
MSEATQPVTTIILNMEQVQIRQERLNYQQLAKLAYPQDPDRAEETAYTITVSYPDGREQSLARGDKPLEVIEGMVINVRKAGRS